MANGFSHQISDIMHGERNLSFTERALSVVGGLGLAALAAQPRPNKFLSLLALIGGSALALRGAYGYCPAKAALMDSSHPDDRRRIPGRY